MEENKKLVMSFDPRTIEHLWISLYSKLPTVLSELVSNSWDADADNITINFNDNALEKEIQYSDDWNGMNFEELNNKFLLIWRNRREKDHTDITPNKKRKVIGKKWLWKLSVFWIAEEVEVITVKEWIKNHFIMNINDIIANKKWSYEPIIKKENTPTWENNWTKIFLKKIKRKSGFDIEQIWVSLSKKFLIFDEIKLSLKHNWINDKLVTNELKFSGFKKEFEWNFPEKWWDFGYHNSVNVKWQIITLEKPIKDTEMKWIYLTSRWKIVNTASFYWLRDTDQFHTYATWYLEVDFIDELEQDVISTDRQSLNWENEEIKLLQEFLQSAIKKVWNEWRKKRKSVKKIEMKSSEWVDIDKWQENLPWYEKELSNKIIDPILEDPNFDTKESTEIISSVIDKFEHEDFKRYASDIAEISTPEEIPSFLKIMDQWEIIESKQFSALAKTRVEVIKKFWEYLDTDTKEVPTLHKFLKKFSWLLDPRILEFEDEVTYTKLLKETYPDESLDQTDRRIDFLCSNALWNILYVVEIKRSKYKVDQKALEQAYEYQAFLEEKYASESGFSRVVCYVIWWSRSSNDLFKRKEKTYAKSWEVFVKTYRELLEQAKEYHKEFIEKSNELSSK